MAFRRKAAVGTALDKEELEDLYTRLGVRIDELKNAAWDATQAAAKAAKAAENMALAAGKMEAAARKTATRGR